MKSFSTFDNYVIPRIADFAMTRAARRIFPSKSPRKVILDPRHQRDRSGMRDCRVCRDRVCVCMCVFVIRRVMQSVNIFKPLTLLFRSRADSLASLLSAFLLLPPPAATVARFYMNGPMIWRGTRQTARDRRIWTNSWNVKWQFVVTCVMSFFLFS